VGVLELLGPDQSTLLFDFAAPTGTGNPSSVITKLGSGLDMGTDEVQHRLVTSDIGATALGYSIEPVEMLIPFTASATTDTNLWAGLGQLARYLLSASVDHPIYLKWTELAETRYIDVVGVRSLPQLLRGQNIGALAALRKNSMGPIPLRLLRQPWMRGPAVTSSSVTVPNDPATGTKVRVFPLTATGDLPTPGRVHVQMDTGSTVERVLIGHRARKSRASSVFADYLSDSGFFQCEATNRTWTLFHDLNTSSVADASFGSGGNVARVTHATTPTVYNRRVRATRTTKIDSLRGAWDVWVRVKAAAARDFRLLLKWGPSTADPPAFANDEVRHNTEANGTPPAFGYVELNLGRIYIPETVPLGGLALEIWTRQASGAAANLDLDLVWLVPAGASTVVVPGGSATTSLGSELTTPPDQITGDPVWTAATIIGTAVQLDSDLDAVGFGPNTGLALVTGRYRVLFDIVWETGGTLTAELRVTNVTDNTEAVSQVYTAANVPVFSRRLDVLQFDAVAGKTYQPQVTLTDVTDGSLRVNRITVEHLPSLAVNDFVKTDPMRGSVDRLDVNGNLSGYLTVEGEVPLPLEPGENHIMVRCDEIPLALYEENENKLARTPTVTVAYDPRYAL
jgi:hypothetical protein